MNSETLKKIHAELHAELAHAHTLDEPSRQLLREIMSDLEALGPAPASTPATLGRHKLEELAVGFEADYPRLAGGLRELMDLLAKAGL